MKKFYVTTAIDYVNAKPHIGHAFEKVLADALIRWKQLKGEETWFLTGTDENAQKNVQAAKEAKIPTKKFVDQNVKKFVELCKKLDVDYDRFIRTTEEEHVKKSQEIFKAVYDKGEIYKGKYEGYYCTGCEGFKTERDLVDGKCVEHDKEPEWMSEEAYFFKLSKYKDRLLKFAEKYIVPNSKKNEIVSRLKIEGLKDLCVSRTNLNWGIDSPIDKKFKIYVWFDALINYVSGANGNWPADVHIVGKGINWFHSVIWPAMLMSSGYDLPKKLLVHGYLNVGGKKMSKSLGNVIDPIELVEKYGSDSVRYSLLRCSVFEDSDYNEEILIERHNNELADKLGNLISRVSTLAEKIGFEKKTRDQHLPERFIKALEKGNVEYEEIKRNLEHYENKVDLDKVIRLIQIKQESGSDGHLLNYPQLMNEVTKFFVEKYMESFQIDKALNMIFASIDCCNEFLQLRKPWDESKDIDYRKWVLGETIRSIREITPYLGIFIPQTAKKIEKIFKTDKIKKSEILFKKIT